MASFCRSALTARSLAARTKTLTQGTLNPKPISSSSFCSLLPLPTRAIPTASRIVSVLGSVESLMPLHTTTANARLKSSIAVDSSCRSCLSQGPEPDTGYKQKAFNGCTYKCIDVNIGS